MRAVIWWDAHRVRRRRRDRWKWRRWGRIGCYWRRSGDRNRWRDGRGERYRRGVWHRRPDQHRRRARRRRRPGNWRRKRLRWRNRHGGSVANRWCERKRWRHQFGWSIWREHRVGRARRSGRRRRQRGSWRGRKSTRRELRRDPEHAAVWVKSRVGRQWGEPDDVQLRAVHLQLGRVQHPVERDLLVV